MTSESVPQELLEAYRRIAPGTLGHFHGLRFMDSGIKPVFDGCRLVGRALTVWAPGGVDLGILNDISGVLRQGDVVVVDRGGDTEHAIVGEFRAIAQLEQGAAGWIVDGAVCDVAALRRLRFPVYSRTISPLVAKAVNLQGTINEPVSCGGVVVRPGELIVADDDGVAVLSRKEAESFLDQALAKEADEARKREDYRHLYESER